MFEIVLKQNNLKDLLKSEKISVTKFAKYIGMSRSHVSQVLNFKKKPNSEFIAGTLSQFTDFKFEQLFFLSQVLALTTTNKKEE